MLLKSNKITAIIGVKNEARRLPYIFENLKDFSEIIVFDGGSEDETEKVCKDYDIKFIKRPHTLRNIVGGDLQFMFSYVKTLYVLNVNCSHYYPKKLLKEFQRIANEGIYHSVYHDYLIYTYGKVVHRPFIRRRSSGTNFYRVDSVNFSNSIVHNEAPVELPENLIWYVPATDEYSVQLLRDYDVRKAELNHSFYSDLDSKLRYDNGKRTNIFFILWKPLKTFGNQYIRCGSILYGIEGFIYSLIYAQLELNIQLKIWEIQNNFSIEKIKNENLRKRKLFIENNY